MWTTKNRARHNRDDLRFPSDLTDAEWSHVAGLIPPGKRGGGKRRVDLREVMASEKKRCATAFLRTAIAYYASLGIKVERVMTDNGSCYKSFAFRRLCKRLGLKHVRTRPYRPRTNGKAERFIQTGLREWAYAQAYRNSRDRKAALAPWLHRYNWHRPHAGIGDNVPISRLGLPEDNLLRLHN